MTDTQTQQFDALRDAARETAAIARDLGLGRLADTIEIDQQRRLGAQRLRVMVLGEIKHGKSTLINALCGEALLPVGVTPTTATVVGVRSGPVSGRFVVPPDGRGEAVDVERFGQLVRGKLPVESVTLEVQVAGDRLPDTIELVDTPGLNDLDRFRGAASRGELPRADVLLLVLDATQALTRTELAMLRDALTAVGGLGRSGARIEVVINRIDLVSDADRTLVVEHLRKQLGELVGREFDPFTTDAKAASQDANGDSHGVREVERLRGRLAELADQRDEILPARMRSSLLGHTKTLRYNALIQARAVTLERERLEGEMSAVQGAIDGHAFDLAKLRKTLEDGRRAIIEASHRRSEEFRRSLQADALGQVDGADLRNLTDVLPGAIQAAFLDFARREALEIRASLERLTDDAIRTHGEHAQRRLLEASLRMGFAGPSIYVEPPSVIIEAGMIALGIAGTAVMYFGSMITGMIMTIASPLATMMLRERSVRDARAQARQLIPTALARAESALTDTVRRSVEGYVRQLDEHLVQAAEAIGEQLLAILRRAEARLVEVDGKIDRASDAADAVETKAETTVDGETEAKSEPEPEAKAEAEAETNAEGETEAARQTQAVPQAKATPASAETDGSQVAGRARAARPAPRDPVEIPDPAEGGGISKDPPDPAVIERARRARRVAAGARDEIALIETRISAVRRALDTLDLASDPSDDDVEPTTASSDTDDAP